MPCADRPLWANYRIEPPGHAAAQSRIFGMDAQNPLTAVPFDEFETVDRCDLCGGAELDSMDRRLRVARCRRCGHTFFDRRPTQQAIARHYDKGDNYAMWLTQAENRRRANIRRIRLVSRFLTRGPILDVGSTISRPERCAISLRRMGFVLFIAISTSVARRLRPARSSSASVGFSTHWRESTSTKP